MTLYNGIVSCRSKCIPYHRLCLKTRRPPKRGSSDVQRKSAERLCVPRTICSSRSLCLLATTRVRMKYWQLKSASPEKDCRLFTFLPDGSCASLCSIHSWARCLIFWCLCPPPTSGPENRLVQNCLVPDRVEVNTTNWSSLLLTSTRLLRVSRCFENLVPTEPDT